MVTIIHKTGNDNTYGLPINPQENDKVYVIWDDKTQAIWIAEKDVETGRIFWNVDSVLLGK